MKLYFICMITMCNYLGSSTGQYVRGFSRFLTIFSVSSRVPSANPNLPHHGPIRRPHRHIKKAPASCREG